MRLCYQLCTGLTLSVLLFSSCTHSDNVDPNTVDNSPIEKEVEIEPLKEINLKGDWVSKDNSLYPILEFKGKSTVVIKTVMGPFVTSYERDEEFIRVKTDKSDLLFEVVNEDSLVGSGYAKGVWIKEK